MGTKELLKQYADTGAVLNKYQMTRLPHNLLKTYFRRRILQAEQDIHNYYLDGHEQENIPTIELQQKYIHVALNKNEWLIPSLINLMDARHVIWYIHNGKGYGESETEIKQFLSFTTQEQQEIFMAKLDNSDSPTDTEWQQLEPQTVLDNHKVFGRMSIYFEVMPERLHKPLIQARAMIGHHISYRQETPELINLYLDTKIMYKPEHIIPSDLKRMTPEQDEKYIKMVLYRIENNLLAHIYIVEGFEKKRPDLIKKYISNNHKVTLANGYLELRF